MATQEDEDEDYEDEAEAQQPGTRLVKLKARKKHLRKLASGRRVAPHRDAPS